MGYDNLFKIDIYNYNLKKNPEKTSACNLAKPLWIQKLYTVGNTFIFFLLSW